MANQPSEGGAVSPRPILNVWYFERLSMSDTVVAIEPDGTKHIVDIGDMNSVAGRELLNAMARDLTKGGPR